MWAYSCFWVEGCRLLRFDMICFHIFHIYLFPFRVIRVALQSYAVTSSVAVNMCKLVVLC